MKYLITHNFCNLVLDGALKMLFLLRWRYLCETHAVEIRADAAWLHGSGDCFMYYSLIKRVHAFFRDIFRACEMLALICSSSCFFSIALNTIFNKISVFCDTNDNLYLGQLWLFILFGA